MQVPLQITFQNMDHSDAMETCVRDRVARLERVIDTIISCHVTLESPQGQQRSQVAIAIKINVPGKDIVVKREQRRHETRGDSYQVIRQAFDIVERQLEEHLRISRHDVKTHHDGPTYARIVQLYPDQDYGFIETPVQLNVYFHKTVVAGHDFDDLQIGTEVLYTLASDEGPMGPQASKVGLK
jgi:ribosomal subunit interface protein